MDAHAKEKGADLAEFRDGESHKMLQEAKSRVGSGRMTGNGLTDSWESPSNNAMADERGRYVATMEKSYDAKKEKSLRRAGQPTGYDAAMRGVVRPRLATTPMFQKKK